MAQLQHSLGSIWRDVDLAGVLEYQRSFATLNAGRKQGAMSVGNYVMHYQPVIEPGSPSKLVLPWCGPFRVQELVRSKNVRIRHIVTGVERTVQMDRLPTSVRRYFKLGTPAEGGEVNLGDNAAQHASNTGVAIDPTKAQVVGGGQRGGGARQSTAMSCDDGGREEPKVVTQSPPQGRLPPLQSSQRVKSANISPANVVSVPTELRPRRRHLRPRRVRLDDSKGHPPQR